jgi:hypothetical protein
MLKGSNNMLPPNVNVGDKEDKNNEPPLVLLKRTMAEESEVERLHNLNLNGGRRSGRNRDVSEMMYRSC